MDSYWKPVRRTGLHARISWSFPRTPWFPGALRATAATHLNMSQILPISNTFPFVNPWVRPYVPLIFASENIVTVFENKDSPDKVITSGLFFFWRPNFQLSSWLYMPAEHTCASTYTDKYSHKHTLTTLTHTYTFKHVCTFTHISDVQVYTHSYRHSHFPGAEEFYSDSPTHAQIRV